jgi:3'(2'), 5'-bisphosphate nucleotidase
MSFFTKEQIAEIVIIANYAGEIAKESFLKKNFTITTKADGSCVTSADIAVSKFIKSHLNKIFPDIAVICEEGDEKKVADEIFFLIDPIDGTSSFISNSIEFSINIALIKNKKAIFGLIYAPLFDGGKMVFCNEKNQVVSKILNEEKKILSSKFKKNKKLRIITSPRSKDTDVINYMSQFYPNITNNIAIEKLSSAIKFFSILENKSDLYLHFRPSMEWDTAAGQALVELMGGKVKNLFFNQENFFIEGDLTYKKPYFKNSAFVVKIHG